MYESVGAIMQVSAISSNLGFTGKPHKRDNVDRFLSYSDNDWRAAAYAYTIKKDHDRQKKVSGLYQAVPLVGALSAGILTSGKASMFGKKVSGLAAKTVNGVKGGGYWAMLLGAAGAIGLATRGVKNASDKADNFTRKHPFITLGAQIAALFAAVTYLPKGAAKLYNMIKPEYIVRAGKGVEQVAEHINKIKAPKFMQGWGEAISNKVPDVVKNIGKTAVAYAPDVTLLTAALASLGAYTKTAVDFDRTYLGLKEKQHQIAQARINELKSRYEDMDI